MMRLRNRETPASVFRHVSNAQHPKPRTHLAALVFLGVHATKLRDGNEFLGGLETLPPIERLQVLTEIYDARRKQTLVPFLSPPFLAIGWLGLVILPKVLQGTPGKSVEFAGALLILFGAAVYVAEYLWLRRRARWVSDPLKTMIDCVFSRKRKSLRHRLAMPTAFEFVPKLVATLRIVRADDRLEPIARESLVVRLDALRVLAESETSGPGLDEVLGPLIQSLCRALSGIGAGELRNDRALARALKETVDARIRLGDRVDPSLTALAILLLSETHSGLGRLWLRVRLWRDPSERIRAALAETKGAPR